MLTIEKKPKEQLGIITAQIYGERGVCYKLVVYLLFQYCLSSCQLRIVGVELGTTAYKKLKDGEIKLLDLITQLNEEDIESGEWFQQSTRDKTMPLLTLMRNHKTPSISGLLSKGGHSVVHSNLFLLYCLTCSKGQV